VAPERSQLPLTHFVLDAPLRFWTLKLQVAALAVAPMSIFAIPTTDLALATSIIVRCYSVIANLVRHRFL